MGGQSREDPRRRSQRSCRNGGAEGPEMQPRKRQDTKDRRQRAKGVGVRDGLLSQTPEERHQGLGPDEARYFSQEAFDDLPALAFDHDRIVHMAHQRLAAKLDYSTIALQFMPEQFTLGDLQDVYETILREPQDKRNFRKRILALDQIEATGEQRRNGAHRPAMLYRVKHPERVEIIK